MPRGVWILPGLLGLVIGMLVKAVALRSPMTEGPRPAPSSAATGDDASNRRLLAFIERSAEVIDDYIRTHSVRKLQIGAGSSRLEGWLNTDIEPRDHLAYLDATQAFPLETGSFHYVFSEHVIEHLTLEDGATMLAESFRVLAPGGRIRIATPDLLQLVALFQQDISPPARRYLEGKLAWHDWPDHPTPECVILNLQLSEFGHRFIYDPGTLTAALTRAEFESVRIATLGESEDPHLRGLEARRDGHLADLNAYETMVIEAVRPAGP